MSSIEVHKLRVSYQPGKEILKGLDFSVQAGEAVALLGHNGSGKSTLLKSLIGLIPASAGKIETLGTSIITAKRTDIRKLRSETGFVFQNHNLVRRLSVLTNIIHGALSKKNSPLFWFQCLAPQNLRIKALEKLAAVGLAQFAGRRADQLSGGQSQRVAIARALMQEPKLLLADEPVASLDPQAGEEVMELMHKLCKSQNITLLFTTHHLEHALKYADRIIALKDGEIVLSGDVKDLDFETLRKLYE